MSESPGPSPWGTTSLCPGADAGRAGAACLTCIPGGGWSGLSLEHLHRSTWKSPEGEGGLPGGLRRLAGSRVRTWGTLSVGARSLPASLNRAPHHRAAGGSRGHWFSLAFLNHLIET